MRYELSDCEWTAIKPMLPNKPCGVRWANDRRVLNVFFLDSAIRCAVACRDPIRQTRGQLSRLGQARFNPHLATR